MDFEFTRPSASGQVVIPQAIRKEMNITSNDRFLVFSDKDTVFFKRVDSKKELESLSDFCAPLRRAAKEGGLTRKDVADAIKWARAKKRHEA